MTVQEYREKLFAQLAGFDPEEVGSVVDYYTELIEDADDPEEQMRRLGSPEQLAEKIKQENGWIPRGYEQQFYQNVSEAAFSQRQSGWSVGRVLALIFTLPFWITVYALIFALWISALSIFIVLPGCFIAAAVGAVRYLGILLPFSFEMIFLAIFFTGLSVLLFRPIRAVMRGIGGLFASFSYFLFMPGRVRTHRKRSKKPLKKGLIIASIAAIVIGLAGGSAMETLNRKNIEVYKQNLNLETFDKKFGKDVSRVSIDIDIGELTILKSTDGSAKLVCENAERDRLKLDDKNGLDIKYSPSIRKGFVNLDFGFSNRFMKETAARFTLYLPDDKLDSIEIMSSLGAVEINGFNTDTVKIECRCGETKISGCEINELTLDNDLGSVEISECSINGSYIEASCGSVSLDGIEHTGTAEIVCDLGSIKLEKCTFDYLKAENSCGDIKANKCAITKGADISLDLGDAKLSLIGDDYDVRASVDLGDLSINGKNASEAPSGSIRIAIDCSTGSVDVDFR